MSIGSEFRTDKKQFLWYTVVATQLSVTGGLLALVSGVAVYHYFIFFAPLTTCLGILLFAQIKKSSGGLGVDYSILKKPEQGRGTFPLYLVISTAFIYIFIIGWELYIGASVLAQLIGTESTVAIAVLMAFFVLIYTYKSSFTRAVLTDVIQFVLVLFLLVALFYLNADIWSFANVLSKKTMPDIFANGNWSAVYVFAATLLIINISAQLQSPANWLVAKSANNKVFEQIQYLSAPILGAIWSVIIIFALGLNSGVAWTEIFSQSNSHAWLVVLGIGVIALISSTVDTNMISISNSINHGICELKNEAFKEFTKSHVRRLNVLVIIMALIFTFGLINAKPDIFYSLLSMSGLLSIYTGYILYHVTGKSAWISSGSKLPTFLFLIFLTSFALQMFGFFKDGNYGFYLILVTTVVGMVAPIKLFYDPLSSTFAKILKLEEE